ncbi:MAG: hypothetical protein ACXWCM_12495, partial [Acidimicrobiales bacterium]
MPDAAHPRRPPLTTPRVAVAAEGLAFAVLVGLAGSPAGRLLRVLVVAALTGAALVLERRTGPAVRAVLLAVLGVVGLTAGAAVGLMHLVKSDLGPPAFAGLLALTGGLVLLVVGSVALVRATPGWWRLVLVPVALVVLQFVVLPVTIAVYATNPPATRVGAQTPVDRGLAYEDVTFATSD